MKKFLLNNRNIRINTMVTRDKSSLPNNVRTVAVGKDSDLIVVLREHKRLLNKLMQPGVTDRLVAESEMPVLIFSA